jgi:hypothetical protein
VSNEYHVTVTLDPYLGKGSIHHQAKENEFANTPTGLVSNHVGILKCTDFVSHTLFPYLSQGHAWIHH